jgi:hypothetical protein
MKVNLLFCQSKDADWYLTDSYYRLLKETGRFNLIDTSLDTDVPGKAVEEAKRLRADVALVLTSKKEDPGTVLSQKLFWVSDGVQFSEMNANIEASLEKELSSGDKFFKPPKEEAWLQFDLAFDARLMTVCDIDGDGKQEIVLDAGKEISVYTVGVDIQRALGGIKIEGSVLDNRLRIDSVDLNRNGRDEIVVTAMKNDDIVSHIYEFNGSEFVLLYKDNVFLRSMGNALIAQAYSRSDGFTGDVFVITWDGDYKKGDTLRLPKGVNIYDFIYLDDPRSGRLLLAYDEWGFLNLYDGKDMRIWRSKTDAGGFLTTFEKKAPSLPIDRGEWSVKDRLWQRNNEILSVKRFPLLDMVKGLGYRKSQIKKLWWNGLSMEEGVLIDNIDGTLFDYAVSGDKIMVLSSPLFGIKAGNILKGENPLKTELYIYKMKGM